MKASARRALSCILEYIDVLVDAFHLVIHRHHGRQDGDGINLVDARADVTKVHHGSFGRHL